MNREIWLSSIRSIFDAAQFPVSIISADFRVLYANPALERTFGKADGKRCFEYYNDERGICPSCNFDQISVGESCKREWQCPKTGRIFEISDARIGDESGQKCKLSIFHDISELKRTERELVDAANRYRESAELLSQTFSSLQEALIVVDPSEGDRKILDCNASAEKMFGYAREELIGKTTAILHVDRPMFEQFRDAATGAFTEGKPYETRFWMKRRDGEVFPTEHFVRPMFDESGRVLKNLSVVRDITERERADEERRRMQEQVHHASKLASIGTLAAGVAHEINNPLTVIRGNLEILHDILGQFGVRDENLVRFLAAQETAINRISEIVKGLLAHVRRDPGQIRLFDLHEAVNDSVTLVDFIYKKQNIRIRQDLSARRSQVSGAVSRIQQVVMNLLVNAKEAIEEKGGAGEIVLETSNVPISNGSEELVLSVRDTGCGIPAENIEKIFGFFFTTKGPGKGTGLGLSITNSIVREMGGRMDVSSEVGVSTTFKVYLPVAN